MKIKSIIASAILAASFTSLTTHAAADDLSTNALHQLSNFKQS